MHKSRLFDCNYNIMGDELLLNFGREISALICNFTCEMETFRTSQ